MKYRHTLIVKWLVSVTMKSQYLSYIGLRDEKARGETSTSRGEQAGTNRQEGETSTSVLLIYNAT